MPSSSDDISRKLNISDGVVEVLGDLGVAVTLQDRDLVYTDVRNQPFGLKAELFNGHGEEQLLGEEAAGELRRLKESVFALREARQAEIKIAGDGNEIWHKVCARPNGLGSQIDGVVAASIDITERRMADEHLRLALLELSHRAKNLLAIVLSIARQTSLESHSLAQFEGRFEGRIRALALAHDILTDEKWRGASVFGLARSQLATFKPASPGQFETEGYDAYLRPNAAQHVGLAIHELVSWSVLSGALSVPDGRVTLSCALEPPSEDGPARLVVRWTEVRIPINGQREESAFGQALLTKIVPAAMEASATMQTAKDGRSLDYELRLPPQQYF